MSLKVKIFSDGANLASILELSKNPLIRGFTTNPSLIKKAGISDYLPFCKEVLSHVKDKPISFEVFADDFQEMKRQAMLLTNLADNVYVKIPITNCEGEASTPLIQELSHHGVKLNVTAVLTLKQVWEGCQALREGAPSVISIFAGRIADTGHDPEPLMRAAIQICRSTGPRIEVLWASCREVYNIAQANNVGCDIITVPPDLIEKVPLFGKDLNLLSLETVRMFKKDADAAGFTL